MPNRQLINKRRLFFSLLAITGVLVVAGVFVRMQPNFFVHKYKPRISAKIDVERKYLIDKVRPLGIKIGEPSTVKCSWNPDTSLDYFNCRGTAPVIAPAYNAADAVSLMQQLSTIDANLQKDGWHISSNDYRYEKPWGTPEQMLQAGLTISYAKYENEDIGCYLEVPIRVKVEDSSLWSFECGKGTNFWLLETPAECMMKDCVVE
jgi:hypothetical protein